MRTLTDEGAPPLLDDSVCEAVHQVASPVEAPPIRGESVQEVHVQEYLLGPFCHEGTELQDGSNIFTGIPAGKARKSIFLTYMIPWEVLPARAQDHIRSRKECCPHMLPSL